MTIFCHTVSCGLLLAALCFTSGCRKHSSSVASLFPDSSDVAGWVRSPEIRSFAPDHLSDYIDGDAEKYLKAGVKNASTADYTYKEKIQVVVDIYTMSAPRAAEAIFESEPAIDAQTPTLGDAARLYSQILIFLK